MTEQDDRPRCSAVAVGFRDMREEAMQAQATQIVGDPSWVGRTARSHRQRKRWPDEPANADKIGLNSLWGSWRL